MFRNMLLVFFIPFVIVFKSTISASAGDYFVQDKYWSGVSADGKTKIVCSLSHYNGDMSDGMMFAAEQGESLKSVHFTTYPAAARKSDSSQRTHYEFHQVITPKGTYYIYRNKNVNHDNQINLKNIKPCKVEKLRKKSKRSKGRKKPKRTINSSNNDLGPVILKTLMQHGGDNILEPLKVGHDIRNNNKLKPAVEYASVVYEKPNGKGRTVSQHFSKTKTKFVGSRNKHRNYEQNQINIVKTADFGTKNQLQRQTKNVKKIRVSDGGKRIKVREHFQVDAQRPKKHKIDHKYANTFKTSPLTTKSPKYYVVPGFTYETAYKDFKPLDYSQKYIGTDSYQTTSIPYIETTTIPHDFATISYTTYNKEEPVISYQLDYANVPNVETFHSGDADVPHFQSYEPGYPGVEHFEHYEPGLADYRFEESREVNDKKGNMTVNLISISNSIFTKSSNNLFLNKTVDEDRDDVKIIFPNNKAVESTTGEAISAQRSKLFSETSYEKLETEPKSIHLSETLREDLAPTDIENEERTPKAPSIENHSIASYADESESAVDLPTNAYDKDFDYSNKEILDIDENYDENSTENYTDETGGTTLPLEIETRYAYLINDTIIYD